MKPSTYLSDEDRKLLAHLVGRMDRGQTDLGVEGFRKALVHAGLEPWTLYSRVHVCNRVLDVLRDVARTSDIATGLLADSGKATRAFKSCFKKGLLEPVDRMGTYRYTPEGCESRALSVPSAFGLDVYDELLACYAESENGKLDSSNRQIARQTFNRALRYARFEAAGEGNGLYDRQDIFKHILSVLQHYGCKHSDPQVVAPPFKKCWQEVFERVNASHGVYKFVGIGPDKWHDDLPSREFGEGSHGVVYAWCNPEETTNSEFSVKIGQTTTTVHQRVRQTDVPYAPGVLALIRCRSAEEMKTRENNLLEALCEARIVKGGGMEWFRTSADSLFSTIRTLFPELAEIVRVSKT